MSELRQSIERLEAALTDVERHIAKLEAENARLREDAARYRWLRSEDTATNPLYYPFWQEFNVKLCRERQMDALIDSAMTSRMVAALGSERPAPDNCSDREELAEALRVSELKVAALREQKDGAYLERNRVVAALAWMALRAGWRAGTARTAIEGWSDDWHGCVYIDLPGGQASWHFHDSQAPLFAGLPAYMGQWDGHDTPEKYRRVAALSGHSETS